jgi:hypothetical protein
MKVIFVWCDECGPNSETLPADNSCSTVAEAYAYARRADGWVLRGRRLLCEFHAKEAS